eukprot:793971-Amphidinium_carterae.1
MSAVSTSPELALVANLKNLNSNAMPDSLPTYGPARNAPHTSKHFAPRSNCARRTLTKKS